jgi:hypothetical protein
MTLTGEMNLSRTEEKTMQRNSAKELRSFGLIVGAAFGLIGLWPPVFRHQHVRPWALLVAGLLGSAALLSPRLLQPVFKVWMWGGFVLSWINTRIILSIVFYVVFTPVGFVMRLIRKDPMKLHPQPDAESYRTLKQPRPGSHLKHQF